MHNSISSDKIFNLTLKYYDPKFEKSWNNKAL